MQKQLRMIDPQRQTRDEIYRYWHGRPDSEIFEEISKMSEEQYGEYYRLRGIVHAEGSARSITRIQRPIR